MENELTELSLHEAEKEILQAPWTFINHLLVFHRIDEGEDPPKVPLTYTWFWVQVHGVPLGFYFEGISWQLRDFIGKFSERLGHNDSFCKIWMAKREEVVDMGWDLSLRAQDLGRGRGLEGRIELVLSLESPQAIRRLQHKLKMYNSQSVFFMGTKLNKRRIEGVSRRCGFLDGIETKVELEWRFTGFYGALFASGKSDAWDVLRNLRHTQELPWLVCGDFNGITYSFEKEGGVPREECQMEVFHKVLEECRLMDVVYSRTWFTWERSLPTPYLIEQEKMEERKAKFRFEAWTLDESFEGK
ncbi:hypothetical protein Goarm_022379, partial [Gossypium armourianum]|nr:hypothetical protein [Gossypium armourianum]